MTQTTPTSRRSSKKASLAATAAAVTKNILGATLAKPTTTEMPQAISEIHVSPEDVIPAGTVITREIAEQAGLDEDDVLDLIDGGHVKIVEVYAMAATDDAMAASQS